MFCSISYTQFCSLFFFFFYFIEASRSAAAVASTQQCRREASLALANTTCTTLAPLLILLQLLLLLVLLEFLFSSTALWRRISINSELCMHRNALCNWHTNWTTNASRRMHSTGNRFKRRNKENTKVKMKTSTVHWSVVLAPKGKAGKTPKKLWTLQISKTLLNCAKNCVTIKFDEPAGYFRIIP